MTRYLYFHKYGNIQNICFLPWILALFVTGSQCTSKLVPDIAGICSFAAHAKAMHLFVLLNGVLQNCFLNLATRSKATNALVKLAVAHQMGNF